MDIRGIFLSETSRHSFNIANLQSTDDTGGATLVRRDSFRVQVVKPIKARLKTDSYLYHFLQTIANIKELDPDWEDDEVEVS